MTPNRIGRYDVERRLGGGGMAEVFLASLRGAEGFSRRVAIKRVLPCFSDRPELAELLVREAKLCAQLHHPNVVSVLDFERDSERGLFLVMELVEGKDLSQLLAKGRVPISLAIFVTAEVLRGLGYAHHPAMGERAGLVHRDVSPQNVLLSWEGSVKVSDFGLAKARAATQASESVVPKGKVSYMSPEQANGMPLDGRSDLFSVGVMLWEMLVGRSLFRGSSPQERLASLFLATIPPPSSVHPEVPDDLSGVVMRLLERDLGGRYATAEEALKDLTACREMPRDGRAELVEILRLRFGEELRPVEPAPSSPRQAEPSPPLPSLTPVLPVPTPLVSSQAPRRLRSPHRLGFAFLAFLAALLAAAAVTAGVAILGPRPSTREAARITPASPKPAALPTSPAAPPVQPAGPPAAVPRSPAPLVSPPPATPRAKREKIASPPARRMTREPERTTGFVEVKLGPASP